MVKERRLQLNSTLGEMLLRAYYALHSNSDFDTVLSEIEAEGGELNMGIGIQALKDSLRKGSFEKSLSRLEGLRPMWEGPERSPSAAPKALLQWLSRLAVQQDSLPVLMKRLKALNLLAEGYELVLAECAQHGTAATLMEMETYGRQEGVQFTTATYCALLKNTQLTDAEACMRVFSEAVGSVGVTKELMTAASSAAFNLRSTAFASIVLKKLPEDLPAEAAGKLLQLYRDDDAKVLSLYLQHFASVDLSTDAAAEQLIVNVCIRSNKIDVLHKMLATNKDCTKRVGLLRQVGTDDGLDHAFKLFREFPEKASCLYNTLIDLCIDGKQGGLAKEVMEEAIKAEAADIVTYNTMIKSHLLNGKTAEAQKTVQLMKTAGFEPNCVTFNELLDACIKQSIGEVWALLDEMKACSVKPNHITCSILLKTIKAQSTTENVERVLDIMDSVAEEMDEVLLSSVVEACIRASRVDLLLPHLKRQCSSKRIQVRGPHTYGSIIRAYGFVNDVRGAWETWREMRSRQIVPTSVTLGCMVEAVVSNGDVEGGYELIKEMQSDEQCKSLLNAVIYGSVLKGFSHQRKFNRFWDIYEDMLENSVKFSIVTFNTMIDACARCGEIKRIPELLRNMAAQGIEANLITYSAILKGYCQENRVDEAFELMQGMVQTTKFKPDEVMYNTLLDGCARQGLYDRGMPLLVDMEAAGVSPSNFTLSVLVKLCSRAKRLERAFEVVKEISTKYRFRVNVHVYNNLVQACIQAKDLNRAFGVLEGLVQQGVSPDVRTYSLLLRGCLSAGEAQHAAGLMRAATGCRGVHPCLTNFAASALQPQGGLPSALISEIIEGISGAPCREERLAVALLKDLRSNPRVRVDPKLQMRITAQASRSC
jgi:pentatricopeptide repeat protein